MQAACATVVSGRVTDAATGDPLQGASIVAYDIAFNIYVYSDSDGRYQFDLPSADPVADNVQFGAYYPGYVVANKVLAPGSATVDFALVKGGSIAGVVRYADGATKHPVPYSVLEVFDASTLAWVTGIVTDADGNYLSAPVPPGSYAVCDMDVLDHYLDVCFGGQALPLGDTMSVFTPVTVQATQVTDGVNFALHTGAKVTAMLRDSYFGSPIVGNIDVQIYSAAGSLLFDTNRPTADDGSMVLDGLAGGDYYFVAGAPLYLYSRNGLYTRQVYPASQCLPDCSFAAGTLVHVPDQGEVQLNWDLFPGRIVRGRVVDSASGLGVAGLTVAAGEPCYGLHCESATTTTDVHGDYTLAHLDGRAGVRVAVVDGNYLPQVWPQAACANLDDCLFGGAGSNVWFLADPVVSGIDFVLQASPADHIFAATFE